MKDPIEIKLITGCVNNSRKDQELLYRRYFDKMYGMCLRHSRDKTIAMTIVNNGYLKVFRNIASYKYTGSFEGWIRRIMYNSVCDYYRLKQNNTKYIELKETYDVAEVYHQMDYQDILLLVDTLSPATKKVFVLYAIEGYKHREIADQIQISESTSKWHLANARKKLQTLIKQNNLKLSKI